MTLVHKLLITTSLIIVPSTAFAQAASEPPPRPTDLPTAPEPAQAKSQLDFYASEHDVSVEEARRRIGVMREAGELADKLQKSSAEDFGGIEIVHRPEFKVVVRFTGDANAKVRALGKGKDFVGEPAAESRQGSQRRQEAIGNALRKAGVAYQSVLNPDGTVDLFVENGDSAKVPGLLKAAGVDRADRIKTRPQARIKAPGRGYGEAKVTGGDLIYGYDGSCSAGFTVYKAGSTATRYMLTAGHCENTLWRDSIALPFVGERYAINQPYDFQWHTKGTHDNLTNVVKNGSTATLAITAMYPPSYMVPGEYVCKYGAYTYKTCGNIYSTSVDMLGDGGKFVQVRSSTGANLSSPGDSGAPWFNETYQEGWGVHSDDAPGTPNDAVFMPLVRIRDAGLELLTTP